MSAILVPAHPVLSLDLSAHPALAVRPFGLILELEAWLSPIFSRLGGAVNRAKLLSVVETALAAGGGVSGALKAVLANLATIVPTASPAVLAALKVAIEGLLIYFAATPAPSPAKA